MNGDPYRNAPQPADRRVINRSGAAPAPSTNYRTEEPQPQPVKEEAPRATQRSSARRTPDDGARKSHKGLIWTLIVIICLIAAGVGGWFVWTNSNKTETGIDTSRYQAVFMSNGQIYFGKLSTFNDLSFKITDIYYPQAQTTSTDTTSKSTTPTSGSIQIYRVTDGVHGPEDQMIIMKSQILYYENLKADSKVTQLIQQNEAAHK